MALFGYSFPSFKSEFELTMTWNQSDIGAIDAMMKRIPQDLKKKTLKAAMKKGGEQVLHAARSKAPVQSGRLVSSLFASPVEIPNGVGVKVGARSKVAYYAHMVERGHKLAFRAGPTKFSPIIRYGFRGEKPFLRPALEEQRENVISKAAEALQETVKKLEKKGVL